MENAFRDYLIKQGYKKYTPSGKNSTVYDYVLRVHRICEKENMTWHELAKNIDLIVQKYDTGGSMDKEGEKSHRAVINALKRYREFVKN